MDDRDIIVRSSMSKHCPNIESRLPHGMAHQLPTAYEELSLPAISSRISFLLMRSGPMASNVDSYKLNSSDRNRVFPRTISLTTKILQGKICRPFFWNKTNTEEHASRHATQHSILNVYISNCPMPCEHFQLLARDWMIQAQ